jgi:DNA-binding NarL/FixJ family response regulator
MIHLTEPLRVLVVDDDGRLRSELVAALEEEGVRVAGEASDGRSAIAIAAEIPADVLVMDLRMPDLNGIEAARQIRLQPDPPEIVLLSAYDDPALRAAALEAGVFDYLVKGCRVEFLAGVVYVAGKQAQARRQLVARHDA